MLILYREKKINVQKIAHDDSTTSYGADKPKTFKPKNVAPGQATGAGQ